MEDFNIVLLVGVLWVAAECIDVLDDVQFVFALFWVAANHRRRVGRHAQQLHPRAARMAVPDCRGTHPPP